MGLTKPRAAQIFNLDYKQSTRVVTTTDITLSGGAPSLVDGVTLSLGDRVLVTAQSTAAQNGLYYVTTVGSGANGTWARTSDGNETGEIEAGMIVMVTEGVIYADTQWKLITDDPIIINTTVLTFTQNYSANSISSGSSNVTVYSNANVTISSAGTSNVLIVSSNGTVTSGTASVTGNISGNYILGNGSQLTGLPATYGNSNVQTFLESGSLAGNIVPSSNAVYSLGNTTNRWSNLWLSNSTIYLGNVVVGATDTSLTVNGANVLIGNAGAAFSTSGNVTGGNILTAGLISATGNITGSYIIGNGSQLTGINTSSGGNLWVVGRTATYYVPIFSGILNIVGRVGNISVAINS